MNRVVRNLFLELLDDINSTFFKSRAKIYILINYKK